MAPPEAPAQRRDVIRCDAATGREREGGGRRGERRRDGGGGRGGRRGGVVWERGGEEGLKWGDWEQTGSKDPPHFRHPPLNLRNPHF